MRIKTTIMNEITYEKMSQIDGNKKLYAILDQYGHTIIQVWSETEPIDIINILKK